jgi:hypothetical protein
MFEQLFFHVGVFALSCPDIDRSTLPESKRQTLAVERVRCHFGTKKKKICLANQRFKEPEVMRVI